MLILILILILILLLILILILKLILFKYIDYFSEYCPHLLCGKNAIKTVDPANICDCYCSCPHNSQGDPLFECTGNTVATA
jgi:hypothetical protein